MGHPEIERDCLFQGLITTGGGPLLHPTLVRRSAVDRRNRKVIQPQVNSELRPMVDVVVQHPGSQR